MPYGKDFLDAVNDMLMDNGNSSRIIKHNCSFCFEGMVLEDVTLPSGKTVKEHPLGSTPFVNRLSTRSKEMSFALKEKMCSACAKAKL